jgi:hypothetical protein
VEDVYGAALTLAIAKCMDGERTQAVVCSLYFFSLSKNLVSNARAFDETETVEERISMGAK